MKSVFRLEDAAQFRSRWIQIEFSQSFVGQPVRPALRLLSKDASTDERMLPSAVLGRARWIGIAPADLEKLEIAAPLSPAQNIRIDRITSISEPELLWKIVTNRPSRLAHYVLSRFRGAWDRAVMARSAFNLSRATEFADFAATRERTLEPAGIDRGVFEGSESEGEVGFVMAVESSAVQGLLSSVRSLAAQADRSYRLLLAVPSDLDASTREALNRFGISERTAIIPAETDATADQLALRLVLAAETEWIAHLKPGDVLDPKAVLLLRGFLASNPDLDVLYADSAEVDPWIRKLLPQLKPDWSPIFFEQVDYVGRPCVFRRDVLVEVAASIPQDDKAPWWSALAALGERRRESIGHLKRVLLRAGPAGPREIRPLKLRPSLVPGTSTGPLASIIIPTRDRVELLRRATDSIRRGHAAGVLRYELIIVDNESRDPDAIEYLTSLETQPGLRVVRHPGAFNFSELVNRGAEAAQGRVLILLNNDCEAINESWLEHLSSLAVQPRVGAVGALLLYDDGRIQHAGVTLGLGAGAGHRDRNMPSAVHVGHLFRLKAVHEISAVTGACLAVERHKFNEVGGFDRAFAVAFNDVDFCLRLQEHGYSNLLAPQAVLKHLESASRGKDRGPKRARFDAEAARFRERWRSLVHDDPHYHPLFSTTRFNDWLE